MKRLLPELIVRAQRGGAPLPPSAVCATLSGLARTVIVAEDHAPTALLLRRTLERWGFTVLIAPDGLAMEGFMETPAPPALVMLDVSLPYVDGFVLVDLIRDHGHWSEVPIIMLTGETGEREITRALAAGANDYMTKPFRLAELEARIARLLPPAPATALTAAAVPG
jgi:DNA-binding response OmpR family regulator